MDFLMDRDAAALAARLLHLHFVLDTSIILNPKGLVGAAGRLGAAAPPGLVAVLACCERASPWAWHA